MTADRITQPLPTRDPSELAEMVRTQRFALEAIMGEESEPDYYERRGLRDAVIAMLRPQAVADHYALQLERLDPDVGIAVCLAGIDDPEAAVAQLQGRKKEAPEWSVEDGHLFVRGHVSDEIAAALQATRPAPAATPE